MKPAIAGSFDTVVAVEASDTVVAVGASEVVAVVVAVDAAGSKMDYTPLRLVMLVSSTDLWRIALLIVSV